MVIISNDDFEKELHSLAYDSRVNKNLKSHNWSHTLRVVNYTKMISLAEFPEHLDDCLIAAYFHDVGRNDDHQDFMHGPVAADIVSNIVPIHWPQADIESIVFAIRYHSELKAPDGGFPIVSNYDLPETINPNIAMALWDSDRLDIVRLIEYRPIMLSHINTKTAKEFANTEEHMKAYD
jgi:hypothetical protein